MHINSWHVFLFIGTTAAIVICTRNKAKGCENKDKPVREQT
ncbi:protein of unknown function [Maridesulfovibrio hydrothermalis AM13 = DSM 14728]|uniref:Uncharacterized protein n=1 Tax=Maridesulfovibrio hydrothermalis AM13 = DSM 14728 TaxID=1121451 RepID=L0RB05_9BACT|nr:protein of unknown function [Maridesulfovibrio hydrothermalis AM13 = DSM 14728]